MLSVIIPTCNRVESLRSTLDSVLAQKDEVPLEIVVVDNNSGDATREVVAEYAKHYPSVIKYAFERRTAFTRARRTGAGAAKGDVLLYIDDDVLLVPGALRSVTEVFATRADAGILAGKIMPRYSQRPPPWALRCQERFNAWSLLEAFAERNGAGSIRETFGAAGPMMAVRRDVYDLVDGFPPDTIGVETSSGERTFKKLYVGPGDIGITLKVKEAGYKVYLCDDAACYHVIPPIRFAIRFWRSRVIGEGHYLAVAQREFCRLTPVTLFLMRCYAYARYLMRKEALEKKLATTPSLLRRVCRPALVRDVARLGKFALKRRFSYAPFCSRKEALEGKLAEIAEQVFGCPSASMHPEELEVWCSKAYVEADYFLRTYPQLGSFLWKIASEGVGENEFEAVMAQLPDDYKSAFVEESVIYNDTPLTSADALESLRLHRALDRERTRMEEVVRQVRAFHAQSPPADVEAILLGRADALDSVQALEPIANQSGSTELLLLCGCFHHGCGRKDIARQYFEQVRAKEPNNPDAQLLASFVESARDVAETRPAMWMWYF
jgi:glycosyltransferase involved in cell wall biosynthesis